MARFKKRNTAKFPIVETEAIIDSLSDAIHIVDRTLKILFANKSFERWLEVLNVENKITNKRLPEVFPFLPKKIMSEYHEVFKNAKPLRTHETNKIKGREIYTETLKIPILQDKEVVQVVTVIRDITLDKKFNEMLAFEHRQLLSIFDSIDEIVYVSDPDTHRVLYANRAARNIFGDMIGQKCFRVLQKLRSPCPFCSNNKIFGRNIGKTHIWEFRNKVNNKWYRCIDKAISWPDGRMVRYEMAIDITERKLAVEDLRKSEETYRTIFDSASDAIFVHDTKTGGILDVNRKTIKMFGGTKKELLSQNVGQLSENIAPYDNKHAMRYVRKAVKGKPVVFEWRSKHKTGKIFWTEVSLKASEILGNKCVLAIVRDIDDRKKMEESVRRNEVLFGGLFKNTRNAIAIYAVKNNGNDFIFKDFNLAAEKLDKVKKEELLGKNVIKVFPGVKKFGLFRVFKRVWKTGRPMHHPVSFYKDERVTGWRENYVFKLPSGEVVAIYEDVTERKQFEQRLMESEEKFRNLAEQSPNMIFINHKGRLEYVNKKCEEVMGYTQREFLSPDFDFRSLVAPEYKELINANFKKHSKKEDVDPYEYAILTKDGRKLDAIISTKLINYEGGKAIMGIITDITEYKKIEKMKDNLVRNVSHGLKTPIAMTEMALNICQQGLDNNKMELVEKGKKIAYNNIGRLKKDINNILHLFTFDVTQFRDRKQTCLLRKILDEVVRDARYLIQQKQLALEVNMQDDIGKVLLDAIDCEALLNNIIGNAIKFTDKGKISVDCLKKGDEIEIKVTDTGAGIQEKDLDKVFDKFFKASVAIEGSGLGLSICRQIVELFGGSIKVESEGLNKGTVVTVVLLADKKESKK